MALRFRKSFTLFPGARLNLSKSGVSLSLGVPGATVSISPRGARATAGIPGSGLSYSATLGGRGSAAEGGDSALGDGDEAPLVWAPGSWQGAVQKYQSGPTAQLTSSRLADLRELMCSARTQKEKAKEELAGTEARILELTSENKTKSFFLWSWAFKGRLAELPDLIGAAEGEAEELRRWINGSGVPVDLTFDEDVQQAADLLSSALESATSCSAVWDVTTKQNIDPRERSAAKSAVTRERISISQRHTPWVDADAPGFHFENANGDPLVFYPGFLLVDGGEGRGPAVISYQDLVVSFEISRFIEEENVPDDAQVIDHTWAKVNKDGSPDRRFKGNYRIPVVAYGKLSLKTQTGLDEVYQFSHAGIGMAVATALIWLRVGIMSKSKFDTLPPAQVDQVRRYLVVA